VAFRLGPDTADEARAIARGLAAAADGCRRHVLFLDEEAGEYGCLAEWDRPEDAEAFAGRPATRAVLTALEARTGKPPRVRVYAMEEGAPL
jgi:quinol monooxygenase YgiN